MVDLKEIHPAVMAILVTAILIGIGIILMQNMGNTTVKMFDCVTTRNETFVLSNHSEGTQLGQKLMCAVPNNVTFTLNASEIQSSGNLTFNLDQGIVRLTGGTAVQEHNGSSVNITYTHRDRGRTEYQTLNESAIALGDFSDWWPIIILSLLLGIVLFLVIRAFTTQRVT